MGATLTDPSLNHDHGTLSALDGRSVPELTALSDAMQSYIRAATVETRREAAESIGRQGAIMGRILPNAQRREAERIAVEGMRQIAQSRQALLGLYMKTQIELAKIKADALVAAQGMQIQTQLARFAFDQIRDLDITMNKSLDDFLERMEPQYDKIEKYRSRPQLYEPALESLNRHVTAFFENTQLLLDGFQNSLNNKVSQITK